MMRLTSILRWTARIWSLLSAAFVLAILIGEGVSGTPSAPLTWSDVVGLALFPTGLLVGLALGWWREIAGGLVGLGTLLTFYVFLTAVTGRVPGGPYFVLLAAPALLFLLAGLLTRARGGPRDGQPRRDLSTADGALDEALEETFPASDPISVHPRPRQGQRRSAS